MPTHGQSRLASLTETLVSVAIGYIVALATQLAIFPILDIPVTFSQNLTISTVFTIISVIRSYAVRRAFNWWANH
jgi:hypothetical protein